MLYIGFLYDKLLTVVSGCAVLSANDNTNRCIELYPD